MSTTNTFAPHARNSAQADLLARTPVLANPSPPHNGAVSFSLEYTTERSRHRPAYDPEAQDAEIMAILRQCQPEDFR